MAFMTEDCRRQNIPQKHANNDKPCDSMLRPTEKCDKFLVGLVHGSVL